MPRMTFTDAAVRALQAPAAGQVTYLDSTTRGFGLRIAAGGARTWTFTYRQGRRVRRLTLGYYPELSLADARRKAKTARAAADLGHDPAAERRAQREAATFAELVSDYLERHAKPRKRSWRADEQMLKKHIPATWSDRKAAEITRRDVRDLLAKVAAKTPIAANRLLACLRKVFNHGIRWDLVEANPCALVERPAAERQRERVLSADELRRLWAALDAEDVFVAALFRLRLLTAQRGGEVRTMEWDELDLDAGWWVTPAEKAKNKRAHRVPLSSGALAILRALPRVDGHDWVFPSTRGEGGCRRTITKAVVRIRKASGVDFWPHDLRRTVATFLTSELDVSRLVVSKLLNHVEQGVTKVYDRASYDREKRAALHAWSARLEQIVSGEPAAAKVIPLRAGA